MSRRQGKIYDNNQMMQNDKGFQKSAVAKPNSSETQEVIWSRTLRNARIAHQNVNLRNPLSTAFLCGKMPCILIVLWFQCYFRSSELLLCYCSKNMSPSSDGYFWIRSLWNLLVFTGEVPLWRRYLADPVNRIPCEPNPAPDLCWFIACACAVDWNKQGWLGALGCSLRWAC